VVNNRREYLVALAIAITGSILFAGKAIFIKLSYEYGASSEVLLALRMIFAFPLFWAVYLITKQHQNPQQLNRKDVYQLCWLGFSGYFLSSYLDFLGLFYISAGLERIVLYLTPAIVVLISYFFLKKPISRLQWISIIIGYLGVILAFIEDLKTNGSNGWLGVGLVFASACLYANYLIFSGEIVKRIGSIRLVTYASSFSAICSVIQVLILAPRTILEQATQVYWFSLGNAVFCTVLPMLMIMIAVQRIGSSLTAQSGILGPVATIFMGWYFLQEKISLLQMIGLVLVIFAVWLLMKNKPAESI
jgi:drug/metabolite transporter (DMT)-like permease